MKKFSFFSPKHSQWKSSEEAKMKTALNCGSTLNQVRVWLASRCCDVTPYLTSHLNTVKLEDQDVSGHRHFLTPLLLLPLFREHHRLWDLHLSKGGPGALGLGGFGLSGLGAGRLHFCTGLPVLRWTGRHHPQIWGRLFLRDGDIRWTDGVSGTSPGLVHACVRHLSFHSFLWRNVQIKPRGNVLKTRSSCIHATLTTVNKTVNKLSYEIQLLSIYSALLHLTQV